MTFASTTPKQEEPTSPSPDWKAIPLDAQRNWRNATCYCCERPATTSEHLPPDNLYSAVQRTMPMLTVPACSEHNNAFSKADEWFRSIIVPFCAPDSPVARDLMNGKVLRANTRNPSLEKVQYDQDESVDIWTPSGIYGGKRTIRFTFSPEERRCLLDMYGRLSRSIYWQYTGRSTAMRRVKLLDHELPWERSFIQDCMPGFRLAPMFGVGHSDVFQFKAIGIGHDIEFVVIWSCFFGKLAIVSIVSPG
jgi:hypothetical protein